MRARTWESYGTLCVSWLNENDRKAKIVAHRIEEVIDRGMCIGCGACGVATGGAIPIRLSTKRLYQADIDSVEHSQIRAGSRVCPFSDDSPNEDVLGAPQQNVSAESDSKLGYYTSLFAGRVENDEYLLGSSSGGLTSWLVEKLISDGHADAVIKVGASPGFSPELFHHEVSNSLPSSERRKSQYYATSLFDALTQIQDDERKFILIGVPCFIRAARALCQERPEYAEKLVFFVSLVCGHFKTQAFAESMAWQVGVHPTDLEEVDFRIKNFDRSSSDYDFGARERGDDSWKLARTASLIGGNWGYNAFQPEACNFCDDVVGETADVSFGDAWLPQYTVDSRGTNVVISRNELIDQILQKGAEELMISLDNLTREDAVQSQAGGFRHRREGLAVRLADDKYAGLSVPRKRVEPSLKVVNARRRALIRHRRRMGWESQKLFAEAVRNDDLNIYIQGMKKEINRYRRIELFSFNGIKRVVKRVVKRD